MIREYRDELGLVLRLKQIFDSTGWKLGECGIGGREDGERSLALEGLYQSGGLYGSDQRIESPSLSGNGDQVFVLGRCPRGEGRAVATAVVRAFLNRAARPFAGVQDAPVLIVVTPIGQLHELGAGLVAAVAANLGWRAVYLGSGLGAADIAGAARQNHARAVALSIVYPADDPNLPDELVRLRELLPGTAIIAGGRAMPAYRGILDKIEAIQSQDLANLGSILDDLRIPTKGPGRGNLIS